MLSVLPKYTHKRTRRHPGGEIVPYLDCGDGLTGICMCLNSSKSIHYAFEVFCLLIIPWWSLKSSLPTHELQTNNGSGEEGQGDLGAQAVRGTSARCWRRSWELNDCSCHPPALWPQDLPFLAYETSGVSYTIFFPNPRQRCFSIDQHGARPPLLAFHCLPPPALRLWRRKQSQQKRRFHSPFLHPSYQLAKLTKKPHKSEFYN